LGLTSRLKHHTAPKSIIEIYRYVLHSLSPNVRLLFHNLIKI
jgi:hypothetical protein